MWVKVVADGGFHVMAYDVPSATTYDPGPCMTARPALNATTPRRANAMPANL